MRTLLTFAVLLLATAAGAQEVQTLRTGVSQPEVRGIESEENGFRHKTPALNRAHVRKTYVDVDELHEHKRAMFGAAPGTVMAGGLTELEQEAAAPAPMPRAPAKSAQKGDPWPWVGGILSVMAIMLLVLVRATGRAPVQRESDRFVITSRS